MAKEKIIKEKIIAVCKPHWTGYIGRIILCFISFLAIISGFIVEGIFVFAICVISIQITRKSRYLELTETKLIGHVGFIKTKTLSTLLFNVQDIGLSNGLMGKLFGYHTITISTAGTSGTEYTFGYMARAEEFVDALQNAMAARQQTPTQPAN